MSEGYQTGNQHDPRAAGLGRDAWADARREASSAARAGDESIGSLLSGLVRDLQELVRGEVRLAKAEVREDVASAVRGAVMIAAGALIGVTGFIFLMLGLTYLLNKEVEMWIAAAIVGAGLAVIAAICFAVGKNRLSASNFKPEQTIETLKEDQEWAKQQVSSVGR